MGDTDLSYEALKRFNEVDARLTALEVAVGITTEVQEAEVVEEEA